MRLAIAVALSVALTACRSEPAPGAGQDWIEVPLEDNVYWQHVEGYRTDTLEVNVPPGPGLEVKLAMRRGAPLVYTWHAADMEDPAQLTSEFHGHTERQGGEPGTVMFYRKATGDRESGSLVAPFDGIHGWFFRNDSSAPIVVQLEVAGFYNLTGQ